MNDIKPGIHPDLVENKFQPTIWAVIEIFSREWYVSRGIPNLVTGKASAYSAICMKPTEKFQQMFNIEREIIVIFSSYESFEPRSITAIDELRKQHQALRFEEICSVLVSKDSNIENEIKSYLKSNQESQIIIPFSI